MTEKAKVNSQIGLGSAGLTPQEVAAGYVGTLCFMCDGEPFPGSQYRFVDVHATLQQLEDLQASIAGFLRELKREGEDG